MKKTILILLSVIGFASCQDEVETSKLLEVSANIATRSVADFTENDSIGLFVQKTDGTIYNDCDCSQNAKAIFQSGKWTVLQNIMIGADTGNVYAYYPYNAALADYKNMAVKIETQTDYLYSEKTSVVSAQPKANLTMKHAMSLVSFQISRNNYPGAGLISHIEIAGIPTTGNWDITSGTITAGALNTFSQDCNISLSASPVSIDFITIPCNTEGVSAVFTVDGKNYSYKFPSGIIEKGKTYSYSLSLNYTDLLQTGTSVSPWIAGNSYTGNLNLITK